MDFGAWLQTWLNVTTRPGEPAFEEERTKPYAGLSTALIWISIASLITGILGWIGARFMMAQMGALGGLSGILGQSGLPPETLEGFQNLPFLTPSVSIGGMIAGVIASIIGFLLFSGLLHLTAKILGGTGNYGNYTYLLSTFYVPLSIVSALVSLVPIAGGCISLIISIYNIVLAHFATRVEHKLSPGKAVVVVLVPIILALLLAACVATVAASFILTLMNSGE